MTALPPTLTLPDPVPDDSEGVLIALETAQALWDAGQPLEAVRFVQRAAEKAEAAGDDLRALSLARSGADLRAQINIPSEPPPPPSVKVVANPSPNVAVAPPIDDFNDQTLVDSPASALSRSVQQRSVQIAEILPPAPRAPVTSPSAQPVVVISSPVVVAEARMSKRAPSVPPPPPPYRAPATVEAPPTVMATPLPAPPVLRPRHEALRVVVTGTDESGMLLSVRVLGTGDTVPPGAREALLVSLEANRGLLPEN